MWTSTRRSRAAHATRSRQVGVAVALLACVGLAACTAAEPPSPASTAEADTVAPFPESGDLDAGTYLVTGYPVPFEITVPDGWETYDGADLGKDDPDLPDEWNVFRDFLARPPMSRRTHAPGRARSSRSIRRLRRSSMR